MFNVIIFIFIIVLILYSIFSFLEIKKLWGYASSIEENTNNINDSINNKFTQLQNSINLINNNKISHGDKITIRSTAHQQHRLQDQGNKLAKFENANRGQWEQLIIEKCGKPGYQDKQACW